MNELVCNSIWRYVGPGYGQGELQQVIFTICGQITSIGAANAFHGNVSEFLTQFEFVRYGERRAA